MNPIYNHRPLNLSPRGFKGSRPKPDKKFPTAKKPLNKKREATGERDLFIEIAKERPHVCVKCSARISTLTVSNFHHVIPKSKSEEGRLDKSNIIIICEACHFKQHNVPKEKRKSA